MLKIAAADQPWLEQLVLGERRRLASLHKTALTEISGSKTAAFNIDAPELTERELEAVNEACSFLEEQRPDVDPQRISEMVHEAFEPGSTITDLIAKVLPSLDAEEEEAAFAPAEDMAHVSSAKKGGSEPLPNEPDSYAVESHKGDEAYKTVVGSKRKAYTENTKNPNESDSYAVQSHEGDKGYENSMEADPHHKPAEKTAAKKTATTVDTTPDPNDISSYAVESHAKEMEELARQIKSLTSAPAFNPNDPLKD